MSDSGVERLARLLETRAAEVTDQGHVLAFHQHVGTFIETPDELDRLMIAADPDLVALCLDVGHYLLGGDPVAALARYGERVRHAHLKDVDPGVAARMRSGEFAGFLDGLRRRVFTEIGMGELDLMGVLRALAGFDYSGWLVVEHDTTWRAPSESAAMSDDVVRFALRELAQRPLPPDGGPPDWKEERTARSRLNRQLHGRLVAAQPGVDEVMVFDLDAAKAREGAEATSGRVAASVEDAMASADAVLIAASTDAHIRLVAMAVGRHLPDFCDKPLAFDLADTQALAEQIEHAGAAVQDGFLRRFDPAYVETHRLVETGTLDTVYLVRLIAHDHEPPPDVYIPVSGGLFRDSSIHDLGQTRPDSRGYDIRMEIVRSKAAVTVGLTTRAAPRSLEATRISVAATCSQHEHRPIRLADAAGRTHVA